MRVCQVTALGMVGVALVCGATMLNLVRHVQKAQTTEPTTPLEEVVRRK